MTGMGIVILFFCAIGAVSVLSWGAKAVSKLFFRKSPETAPKKKYINIGKHRPLVCYDDLPDANKYNGRTWLGGLPVLADVVHPDKHDYSTIIYMDHWFKQYVYDVMAASFTGEWNRNGIAYYLLFPAMFIVVGISFVNVLIVTCVIFAWLFLWYFPSGMPMVRSMGETAKNLTPADWRKIYQEVAEEQAAEDSLARAIRKSGAVRWPW